MEHRPDSIVTRTNVFGWNVKAGKVSSAENIYSALSGESIKDIESKFKGKMYSDFKEDLAEVVIESLSPIQARYNELINDKSYLSDILSKGAEKASQIAYKTIQKVYKKSGLIQ